MKFHYGFYFFSLVVIHAIYALVFLGIFSAIPKFVYVWNIMVQLFLCFFLMYRYNPFRTSFNFKPIDARLIFGSAVLLLLNIISLPVLYSFVQTTLL